MCLGCFERALSLASGNECAAEVWYNVSTVAMSLGDIGLAYQVSAGAVRALPDGRSR